jgi:hypothetical protein
MQLAPRIEDYILRDSFVDRMRKKRRVRWVALPVEVHSFSSPKSKDYPELFTEPLLKLVRTGVDNVDMLSSLTGLNKDLVRYILSNELSDNIVFVGGDSHLRLTDEKHRPHASLSAREMQEHLLFRLPVTGVLVPRAVPRDERLWKPLDYMKDDRYPIFQYGSKGLPYRVDPFVFPPVNSDGSNVSEESVRKALSKHLQDYSAAVDYHEKDTVKEYASRMSKGIRSIESIEFRHWAYLITAIVPDDNEQDGWSCADPFGVFLDIGLADITSELAAICEQSPVAKKYMDSLESSWLEKKDNVSADHEVQVQLSKRFPLIASGQLRDVLAKLVHEHKGLGRSGPERLGAEGIIGNIRKLMEALLGTAWNDACLEDIKLFSGENVPDFDRRELLLLILQELGSDNARGFANILKKQFSWRDALTGKKQFLPLLLGALISARDDVGHPLRKALHNNSSILWEMRDLVKDAGGSGAHYTGKGGPLTPEEREIVDSNLEHALRIVETFCE